MSTQYDGRSVYALSTSQALDRYRNTGSRDLFVRDSHLRGFGLRITPRNTKSFFVESRHSSTGKVRRIVLGQYPLLSLKDARKRALEALRALKYGESTPDPGDIKLRTIIEAFLDAKAHVLRERSIADYRMIFYSRGRREERPGQGCFPSWMDCPVTAISGKAVIERYNGICEERGIGTANKATRVLNGALNYARAVYPCLQDWANPVSVLSAARCRRPLKPRTRHIPLEKLSDWLCAVDAEADPDIRLLFKLLLMTGLRSKEARSLKWTQVDLENGSISIGTEQAKNHQAVTLPLNSWLGAQLRSKERRDSVYVFERANVRAGYIQNLKRPLERIKKHSGLEFTPHDLRRSFATYLDTVGTPFGVIKQLLNHKSKADVTERYIQGRGLPQLTKFSESVLALIESASQWPSHSHGP